MGTRLERDSLGTIEVAGDALWGAVTERARRHFRIGSARFPRRFIAALGLVKKAAAEANARHGALDGELAQLIVRAADAVAMGTLDEHFPLSVWQTGSGTQTNMNANEVIANHAEVLCGGLPGMARRLDPNEHVNRSQSSNDVFPTAMHVASVSALDERLLPQIAALERTFASKATEFRDVVKLGRTHLQDATPLTLGQEIGGWAAQLEQARVALERHRVELLPLAIGGTAVGTGINAPKDFGRSVADRLAAFTGVPYTSAANKFAALAAHDAMVALHGGLRVLACALMKIANDVRWLASGPRAGLGELCLPANEPGSSIMPGKVNPTQCEALTMVCARVLGNDVSVGVGGMSGNFELNVYKPLIATSVLESIELLADAVESFDTYCASGIEPNRARIREHLEESLMLVTALVPLIGYAAAACVAMKAHAEGSTLREAALALGVVSAEDFDGTVVPERMI